jgi:hypothetical protein
VNAGGAGAYGGGAGVYGDGTGGYAAVAGIADAVGVLVPQFPQKTAVSFRGEPHVPQNLVMTHLLGIPAIHATGTKNRLCSANHNGIPNRWPQSLVTVRQSEEMVNKNRQLSS